MSSSSWQGSRRAVSDVDDPSPAAAPKRQRMDGGERRSYDDYTVGWVSALPLELAAARAMLDEEHEMLPARPGDNNTYTLGRIGRHNVAMACLSQYGTANAAAVASDMRRSFPKIRLGFMVGIGGGVPSVGGHGHGPDVRLGDVVVGNSVVQYDLGKTGGDGQFQRTGGPGRPPSGILAKAVANLRARHELEPSRVPDILADMLARYPTMNQKYARLAAGPDRLFDAAYRHCGSDATCDDCDTSQLLPRPPRRNDDPEIHYGKIASGNQVIKHGETRDRWARELDAVCFEMEAAGLIDASFPCLVVRGISDYADSHKNKQWQEYAAAAAAAYAKELIANTPADTSPQVLPDSESLHQRRRDLLDSLIFDEMESRQATIKKAHSRTCRWLFSNPDYSCWLNPDEYARHHGFLWINGKPGAGKSTLMKYVYEHEKPRQQTGAAATLSFFFNARGAELEKSTEGMYRSLVVQLLKKLPDLQQVLDEPDLCPQTQNGSNWDVESLHSLFTHAVMKLGDRRLTCFVDALDECDDKQVQEMVAFFEDLGNSAAEAAIKLYFCFSSRHYPHIIVRRGLRLTLEGQPGHTQDLERYVEDKLTAVTGDVNEIRDKILRKSGGVFMWVVLVVDILNGEYRDGRLFDIKDRLEELPEKLSELFRDILRRDNKNMADLRLCIQWILYAKRPLRREEFYFALVSKLNPTPENLSEWDPERLSVEYMDRFVLNSSKGLAEVTKAAKRQTVQFIHESVRDFFVKDNGLQDLWPELGADFESLSHEQLKQCCYTYITIRRSGDVAHSQDPGDSPQRAKNLSKKRPFLEYATRHVLNHAESASMLPQDMFLDKFDLGAWIKQWNLIEKYKVRRYTQNASLLYILAEMNLGRLIQTVRRLDPHIDFQGERHQYPLFAALANGHRDAVRALLYPMGEELPQEDGMIGNIPYGKAFKAHKGRTPLIWAIENNHIALVKLLLETRGVEPDRKDRSGQTPLICAAKNGQIAVVQLLLKTGVDPNSQDRRERRTPLLYAVEGGHADIVKHLLAAPGVDPNLQDRHGETPLLCACLYGHAESVKLLLNTGRVDCNARDLLGKRTPLDYAVDRGQITILQLLLATPGIDLSLRDNRNLTPLARASTLEHRHFFPLLLNKLDIDYNTLNYLDESFKQADTNSVEAVQLLAATRGIDLKIPDQVAECLLLYATTWGYEVTVRLLLEKPGINPNARSPTTGETTLYAAARRGHETIAKLLIRTPGIDLNDISPGMTPLSAAAGEGHEAIVKLLLEERGIDPNARSQYGSAPLHSAAEKGHEAIVKLLLDMPGIDPNAKFPQYPILSALFMGHEAIVGLFIAAPEIDLNVECDFGSTLLHNATRLGYEAIVERLLATGKMDPNAVDIDGQTALGIALGSGYMGIAMQLLEMEMVFKKEKERSGWIPREATHEAFLRQLRSEHALTH